jgi:beta-glucosidase
MRYSYPSLLLAILLLASCSAERSQTSETARGPFRDLNKNRQLDSYEDQNQPLEARIEDLLAQMTLEEKAGMMFINGAFINEKGTLAAPTEGRGSNGPTTVQNIQQLHMVHFNVWDIPTAPIFASWYNKLQQWVQDSTRLGIPVTIASDPRNGFSSAIYSLAAGEFSQWPDQLGFGAIGDPELVRQHAEMARQEYLAIGIREALHPVADLATEPRWPRIGGTFGEDAELAARLTEAYILGFQGESLGPQSVATMTKHFAGGGPQKEGLDPHFEFQKGQVYPGNNFRYHLIPFEAAFRANTAAIMPYYGIPTDQSSENVAFSFNKEMITKLLREEYKFDGIVCTDWGLITDANLGSFVWPARAWGVEHLSPENRVLKPIEAGVDQFGGEQVPQYIVSLVKQGKLSEERIEVSVRRLLRQKFQLGLFDNPFVDETQVSAIVGKDEFKQAGEAAQRRAMTLLKNDKNTLPLKTGSLKLYVKNVDPAVAAAYGQVVEDPKQADIAIIRLQTPWVAVETENFFAKQFHHGDLDFKEKEKQEILGLLKTVPTVVDLYLDRPAVIPEINAAATAVLANFGASDAALLDVAFGKARPEGKLPFELPSSMEAVRKQKEDLPHDSENPLYTIGHGLSYQ